MDSFINFFSSKIFICFLISLSFPEEYGIRGEGAGLESWGLEVTVFWKGQLVGGQLTLVQYVHLKKKQFNPAMHSFSKRSIHSEETISTC